MRREPFVISFAAFVFILVFFSPGALAQGPNGAPADFPTRATVYPDARPLPGAAINAFAPSSSVTGMPRMMAVDKRIFKTESCETWTATEVAPPPMHTRAFTQRRSIYI
jgi:hypothetical protein